MGERKGTKALELWCRRMADGYPGVKIENMTTSWRDGLGFCAIIHHFRPDLIDFSKLKKDDIYHNNELAFRIAERHLGIPALLEPEDMVECTVPDRLSILTYLSQFYQAFSVRNSPNRIAPKRPQTSPDHGIVSPTSTSPPTKMAWPGGLRREPCSKCAMPVFIAERLNVGKRLFHRTCFRCARCSSQLALANYYETETGDYCCEICPDEEKEIGRKVATDSPEKSVLFRSMSDEEKTASLKTFSEGPDAYSTQFETAMEQTAGSMFAQARSKFIQSHLNDDEASTDSGNDDIPPDLPKSEPPNRVLDSFSDADSGFPSHTVQSSVSDSASGQYDVTKDGLVKARTKLFEDKSDVHTYVVSTNTVAAVVPLDDLEDFDNISKNDVEIEVNPPEDSISKECEKEHDASPEKEEKRDEDVLEISKSSEEIDVSENKVHDIIPVESQEDTPISHKNEKTDDEVIVISDESVVEILDSSKDSSKITTDNSVLENVDISDTIKHEKESGVEVIVTQDSSSDINLSSTKNDDIAPENLNVKLQKNSESSFQTATTDLNSSCDSNVPKRGYYTAHEEKPEESPKDDIISPQDKSTDEQYPGDLNPFSDDEDDEQIESMNTSLNPFGDDDDDDEEEEQLKMASFKPSPSPRLRKKIIPTAEDREIKGTPEHLSRIYMQRISVNPLEEESPQPANRKKKVIKAEKISLNPFESDEEEDVNKQPVPTPRTSRTSMGPPSTPTPRPRDLPKTTPTSTLQRKKKQAPKPPGVHQGDHQKSDHETGSLASSLASSPSHSLCPSPRLTPRHRKSKRAPLPPNRASSTPITHTDIESDRLSSTKLSPVNPDASSNHVEELEHSKCAKDEENRNRQQTGTQSPTPSETTSSSLSTDKSTHGKWKRGKGKAPPRPVAVRRAPRALPLAEIRRELEVIEVQQQGLEKQGVRLEQIIREKCEGGENNITVTEESVPIEVEDLILQLFELVNEKNELFRKQTELMYLKRQHRLEEEYADVDYQIRCLMLQPEANKTDSDKAREEELINRLVNIVERRNEIVECLEMDRVREAEEDDSINNQLNLYTLKREEKLDSPKSDEKKKKSKSKKINKLMHTLHKHKDKEKAQRVDVDKDVDETESKQSSTGTLEKKKKKKFNLF